MIDDLNDGREFVGIYPDSDVLAPRFAMSGSTRADARRTAHAKGTLAVGEQEAHFRRQNLSRPSGE